MFGNQYNGPLGSMVTGNGVWVSDPRSTIGMYDAGRSQFGLRQLADQVGTGDYRGAAATAFRNNDSAVGLGLASLMQKQTEAEKQQKASETMLGMLGLGGASPSQSFKPASIEMSGSAAAAIKGIESGGNYKAVGPATRDGDRAYGAYQVMGKNVGPWTEKHLGRRMTVEEFMADPKAQDAVFQGEFEEYQRKFGPEGAAQAWFGGPGAVGKLDRKDVNGMTIGQYGQKFMRAFAPDGTPIDTAQATVPQRAAPQAQQAGSGAFGHLSDQQLAGALAVPGIPDALKSAVQNEINRRAQSTQPTEAMRNYEAARRGGYTGSFIDYQQSLRAKTEVNLNQTSESEFAKKTGAALAERFDGLSKDGDAAANDIQLIQSLRSLGDQFRTGGGAVLQKKLGELGIEFKGTSAIQAYSALIDRLTPQQRVPGSGATSDFDAKMFKASLPNLMNTPGGNELILRTMEMLAENRMQRAEIATKAQTGEIGKEDALKQLRALQKVARDIGKQTFEASRDPSKVPAPQQSQPQPTQPQVAQQGKRLRYNAATGDFE